MNQRLMHKSWGLRLRGRSCELEAKKVMAIRGQATCLVNQRLRRMSRESETKKQVTGV